MIQSFWRWQNSGGAHPDSQPDATFSYTETTVFVPVRYKRQLGFFPAYIYPSTYEPISART